MPLTADLPSSCAGVHYTRNCLHARGGLSKKKAQQLIFLLQYDVSCPMELLQPKSSGTPVATLELESPLSANSILLVRNGTSKGSTREFTLGWHQKMRAQSLFPAERSGSSGEAREEECSKLVADQSPEEDSCCSALERHLKKKSSTERDTSLPPKNRMGILGGPLAEHQSALSAIQHPQVFDLSANLSHANQLTERAGENPDIYEVDWHSLEFKPVFHDHAEVVEFLRSSPTVKPSVDNLVQKNAAQEHRESTHASRKPSRSCYLPNLQTSALPITSSRPVHTKLSLARTSPSPCVSPTFASTVLTGIDAFSRNARAVDSAGTRRAASWERTRLVKNVTARSPDCWQSQRGRSVSPKASARASQPAPYPERGCSASSEVSNANVAFCHPPFPYRVWTFSSARHTFSRLETLSCSDTPISSEAVQAFAGLARLKHLRLVNCGLQGLGFLSSFVNALPLESLIVPFNNIATVSFSEYIQPVKSSGRDGGGVEIASISRYHTVSRDVQKGMVPLVVGSEACDQEATRKKDGITAELVDGTRHPIARGRPSALQCGWCRDHSCSDELEGRSKTITSAAEKVKPYRECGQREALADAAPAERFAENIGDALAESVHESKHVGEKLRRQSTEAVTGQADLTQDTSSGFECVFPNSLRVVDLSYNRLGDAHELLPFCAKFKQLRKINICGNTFPHFASSLLQRIGYTVRSKGIRFLCEGKLSQTEDTCVLPRTLPSSSPCQCTPLAGLHGEAAVVPCSLFCQSIPSGQQATKKCESSPATSFIAANTVQRLQELVKCLAKEKATLAKELEQARHVAIHGGREGPSANHQVRDGGEKRCATPLCYAGVTPLKYQSDNGGKEVSLWPCNTVETDEIKTAGVNVSLHKGRG